MNTATKNAAAARSRTQAKPGRSAKASGLAGMTDRQLRAYLLAHITVGDASWAPGRQAPPRNEGESRDAYIKRVLR